MKSKSQEFIRDRNYLLFLFGVYEGRRITDILSIKVGDIQMDKINMIEKKTRKETGAAGGSLGSKLTLAIRN